MNAMLRMGKPLLALCLIMTGLLGGPDGAGATDGVNFWSTDQLRWRTTALRSEAFPRMPARRAGRVAPRQAGPRQAAPRQAAPRQAGPRRARLYNR